MTVKMRAKKRQIAGLHKRAVALQPSLPRVTSKPKRKLAKLTADLPSERALETILLPALGHVRAGRETLLTSEDPKGPHQVRVGLRRLRSALHGFRSILKTVPARDLVRQCRTLARIVGELRDADVLVEDVVLPLRAQLERHPGFPPLLKTLQEHKDARRLLVRAALKGPAWLALQGKLERWPNIIDTDSTIDVPFAKVAAKALTRSWREVDAYGIRLKELSDIERHELRKALKRLRYQVELFAPIYKKKQVGRFLASLRTLQDDFGYLNDVALAGQLDKLIGADGSGSGELHRIVGFVIGWHTARADDRMTSLEADWNALRQMPRFW